MLKINRIKIEIKTAKGNVGFDKTINNDQLALIFSHENTAGKSSIISAIYYGLGLEEIMGGKGYKVLTNAFKNKIFFENIELDVLTSKIYLEISNGKDTVTIYRRGKDPHEDENLVTVYYSTLDNIFQPTVKSKDMYVHLKYSATNESGFFTFLERFLNLNLPIVPTNNDIDRKLYLQLIFSAMFIEQKRGWGDLFSGMPHFGIKEQKKRVIEYILNLDTFYIETEKTRLKTQIKKQEQEWLQLYNTTHELIKNFNFEIYGIKNTIEFIEESEIEKIKIGKIIDNEFYSTTTYYEKLVDDLKNIKTSKKKSIENIEEFEKELDNIKKDILEFESKVLEQKKKLAIENKNIINLKESLSMLETDITNNKDALRLKNLGSNKNFNSLKNICPTCQQSIADSVLLSQNSFNVMSLEENINHLNAQKELIFFTIKQKHEIVKRITQNINTLDESLKNLRFLHQIINDDIFSPSDSYSESAIYKKVELKNEIAKLHHAQKIINSLPQKFIHLSEQWKNLNVSLKELPKNSLSQCDIDKLTTLSNYFTENLTNFGYKSSSNIKDISISQDTLLPIIKNFDMRFDSSASDHIRGIWAFTIALLQTSNSMGGNHPGILIFDEPGQHSIVYEDIKKFFETLENLSKENQIIVGITINDSDLDSLITKKITLKSVQGIDLKTRAFKPL